MIKRIAPIQSTLSSQASLKKVPHKQLPNISTLKSQTNALLSDYQSTATTPYLQASELNGKGMLNGQGWTNFR